MSESTPNRIEKYYAGYDSLFLSCLPLHPYHEKFGKCMTSFNQEFIKSLNILSVKQVFLFSITMQVKYNAALLVVNYLAKILNLKVFLKEEIPLKIFVWFPKSALVKLNLKLQ